MGDPGHTAGGPGLEAVAPTLPGPACREASEALQGSPWWGMGSFGGWQSCRSLVTFPLW